MRANAGILIFICLLFLVGTVAANIPDTVTITSDKSYVFAGSGEQSTITVTVTNQSNGVSNAYVNFSVNDPALGTLNPETFTTGTDGKATSIFKVKTKSGFAVITVGVYYSEANVTYSKYFNITQKIDHNKAYDAKFQHPYEGDAGSTVPFNISFTDYWGNPIDQVINPLQQHTINLHVNGPTPGDCNFVGYGHDISNQPLNINGNVSVQVKLTSGAGENSVTMDQFELIPPPAPRIITALSSEVFDMEQLFNPDSPSQVPADGSSKFSIIYTLIDKFGNPANKQEVWVNTSVGGNMKFKTDNLGQISITYGPRITVGIINITATAVNNNTVTRSHLVEFTSTAATTMVLTANPEYMASRDVDPLVTSDITATVMDISGNPVKNETVTFSMGATGYPGGPYNVTLPLSSLTSVSAITDANGHAVVQFIPGRFTTNSNDINFSSTATGTRSITAHWNTTDKNILVTWKNYPYLSVKTAVNPQTIEVNQTVDVTISLKADGWALQPKPIDVVLCTDRSGSMLYDDPDRMYSIREAGKVFVDQMNVSRDYLGLVTFGRNGYIGTAGENSGISYERDNTYNTPVTYSDYATVDKTLSNGFAAVKTALNNIVPDHGTPMRSAIYKSVNEINTNGRSGNVKAIILLSDGDYNWYGDPLARRTGYSSSSYGAEDYGDLDTDYMTFTGLGSGQFSEQNMSVYAKNHGIKIYSIAFANSMSSGGRTTLSTLANATGGKYYTASATNIVDVYKAIAGDLQDTAGVNTTMVTDFQNINVTGISVPGSQVYDYVYNSSPTTGSTRITWQDGITNVTNQSADWAADNKLNFTIGTMKVGQTWEATFRLKVKKSGSIDLFGVNSALFFNNGAETLTLPHTFFTVVPSLNATGFEQQQIDVVGTCVVNDPNKAILPVTWTTTYTGGETDILDEVNYIDESGAHTTFYTGSYHVTTSTSTTRSTTFDMKTVPLGHHYDIEVRTYTANAQDSTIACGGASYNTTGKQFIKLE
jgi:hypothetical protein